MKLEQLDETDFKGKFKGRSILFHEFESDVALMWHIIHIKNLLEEVFPGMSRVEVAWELHELEQGNEQ